MDFAIEEVYASADDWRVIHEEPTDGGGMTIWIVLGVAMFLVIAFMGERNALWIPALVPLFAAAANVFAGTIA